MMVWLFLTIQDFKSSYHIVEKFHFDIAVIHAIHMGRTRVWSSSCSTSKWFRPRIHPSLPGNFANLKKCEQTAFGSVLRFWRLSTYQRLWAGESCNEHITPIFSEQWTACSGWSPPFDFGFDELIWIWLKIGIPTWLIALAGRLSILSRKGTWCHRFEHRYEITEQKSAAVLRLGTLPLVQRSANNPGFFRQRAGSALHNSSSCWGIRGWSRVLVGQTGNIESFQCSKVLKTTETLCEGVIHSRDAVLSGDAALCDEASLNPTLLYL